MLPPPPVLRIAINTANTVSTRVHHDGRMTGRAIDLATTLGEHLGRGVEFLRYDGPGLVLAAGGRGDWDIAFLASDPARAAQYFFTKPYLSIEATFAVEARSAISSCAELDQPNVRIASVDGTGYGLQLSRWIDHAAIFSCRDISASLALFASGNADAVAGTRPSLESWANAATDVRVLDDDYATLGQAIATSHQQTELVAALGWLEHQF